MKLIVPCLLLAAGCVTAETPEALESTEQALNGDTWGNADMLQPQPYGGNRLHDVAFGLGTQVYAVGTNASGTSWVFRKSSNSGITYVAGSGFSLAGASAAAQQIAVDAAGRIVVAGTATDHIGRRHVVIRLSTDEGATFQTVDDLIPDQLARSVTSIAVDGNGQFTVAINTNIRESPTIIRRSKPGALSWTTVANPGPDVRIRGVCATSNGLVGTGNRYFVPGQYDSYAETYRYANGAWTRLDSYHVIERNEDMGTACAEVNGAMYVGVTNSLCQLRRSADAGLTWSVVDVDGGRCFVINDIGPGKAGRVYWVGRNYDDGWVVRRSSNGTTWVDSDLPFSNAGTAYGYAYNPATNATTVVGTIDDATGVRRLLSQQP